MNSILVKILPAAVIFALLEKPVNAQTDPWKYELGIHGGVQVYQGDLTPSNIGSYRTLRPIFGATLTRILTRSIGVKAAVFRGGLHGDDARYSTPEWRRWRNFNFSAPTTELSLSLVWDVLGRNHSTQTGALAPYFSAGLGYVFLRNRRDWSKLNTEVYPTTSALQQALALDTAASPPRGLPVLPVAAGIKYRLSERLSAGVETTYRISSTDYLDGFSYSGNEGKKDFYFTHTVGIYYNWGRRNRLACPRF